MGGTSSGLHWTDDIYRKGIALTGGVSSSDLLEHVFSNSVLEASFPP
jgi:hypothetical protein